MSDRSTIQVTYDLDDVLEILRRGQNKKLYEPRRIKASVIDHFLFSGRFNSVLGLDGFRIFKAKLKEVIARVNDDDFGPNLINLDKMFEALLDSGLYYVEKHLPEELAFLKKAPLRLSSGTGGQQSRNRTYTHPARRLGV